ncbi:hypothetical protein AAFF_G00357040 [Aldrovandia affinis]|uniref:Uncharacterized protein n=1 Tax=Aldrovandia affinis TaxID=143900 RepID=A0AAD7T8M8_9TELE|nr:hypothetical protein AAFF_G00357040 [Aldrovandia affinis]
MKYVAQGLQPFSLVEQEPFKVFVKDLLPNASWTKDDATIRMGVDYIKQHMEAPSLQLGDATSSSDEEDFFSALQAPQAQDSSKELDQIIWTR